ncbi:HNH endonuclease signature motif containing protein [Nocardia sp. NBC_01327]|uniref:HNH endonuclease signature motif containing protein n=1 Tax=Nocardia sp. NBC_01327 TaxID=2903593 RepID=UPI002E0D2074
MNPGGETVNTDSAHALSVAVDHLLNASLVPLHDDEFIALMREVETCKRKLEAVQTRFVVETTSRGLAQRGGVASPKVFLRQTLGISRADAASRVSIAVETGPRIVSGVELEPTLAHVAAAHREGVIGVDHVRRIMTVMNRLPGSLDMDVREATELQLTEFAPTGYPEGLPVMGEVLLAGLDPDGSLSSDADRERMRGLTLGAERADGMSPWNGEINRKLRSVLEPVFAKLARPGMCNPKDPQSPWVSEHKLDAKAMAACAERDTRTPAQRNHDALLAFLRPEFGGPAKLGKHRGLPVSVIVTMSVTDLEADAGVATTASGGIVSIPEALELASKSNKYLAVLNPVGLPLYLGRGTRSVNLDRTRSSSGIESVSRSAGLDPGAHPAGFEPGSRAGGADRECGSADLGHRARPTGDQGVPGAAGPGHAFGSSGSCGAGTRTASAETGARTSSSGRDHHSPGTDADSCAASPGEDTRPAKLECGSRAAGSGPELRSCGSKDDSHPSATQEGSGAASPGEGARPASLEYGSRTDGSGPELRSCGSKDDSHPSATKEGSGAASLGNGARPASLDYGSRAGGSGHDPYGAGTEGASGSASTGHGTRPAWLVFGPRSFGTERVPRLASPAQRLALIASEKGCTRPGCDAPATMCAVHHITEWSNGGRTDIDNLTLACDHCHAQVHDGPGGWKTVVMGPESEFPGRTGWIGPAHINPSGVPQVNHLHHPLELKAAAVARIRARNERELQRYRQ